MQLEIENKVDNDTSIVVLKGVLDVSTVDAFKNSLENVKGVQTVNIDFSLLKFIDSTGIGGLAQAIKKCQANDINIKVANISQDVFEVLDILGLPEIFGEDVFELKKN